MGMLMNRHRPERKVEDPDNRATRRRKSRRKTAEQPAPPASPYADLTDEQVSEAYTTNVGREAEGREAQQAELEALDAENGQPDNG